jgi:hypothetical protein
VVNVETGMNGWLQAKLPVIRPALPEEPSWVFLAWCW